MPTLLYIPRFDEHGAGPRYRVYQYLDSIKKLGFDITIKPFFNKQYVNDLYFKKNRSIFLLVKLYLKRIFFLTRNKSKFDLVLMDGELFPFLPYFFEKLFLPKHFIIDQDDAIFHTYDQHRFFLVRLILRNKIKKIWRNSYCVIVCNQYVKQKAIEMGIDRIVVLPTAINADIYSVISIPKRKYKNKIVIGWVGSPSTISSVDLIKNALINVSKKANVVLYIIGAQYHLPEVETYCTNWEEGWNEIDEIKLTNAIDIGIMPLLDGPYQKGKGGFKLIKYMACEKPIIASPVGVNLEIVDHDINGYLAFDALEWEKYLLILIEDEKRRKLFGKAGRKKMLAQYSFQVVCPVLCDLIEKSVKKEELFPKNIKKKPAELHEIT